MTPISIPTTVQAATKRLKELAQLIAYHDNLYYNQAAPEITDAEYDRLRRENATIEAAFPALIRADSPTHRVGAAPLDAFQKVEHMRPMISLADVFSEDEFQEFLTKMNRFLNLREKDFQPMMAELKIDGLSASLIYEHGILKQAATRGDGFVGEDVTQNVKTIQDIPLALTGEEAVAAAPILPDLERFEVRGEVYMTQDAFDRLNADRAARHESLFANPRNAAAGSLRQLDSAITRERRLRFFAYEVIAPELKFTRQDEIIPFLQRLGFKTAQPNRLCPTRAEAEAYFAEVEQVRASLPFDIDGVVYKLNDRSLQERLGEVGRVPRHSVARKFPAEQATTRLIDILFQIGRTGALTPVAILEPVLIGGARVSRATLHNTDEIARLGVHLGDRVVLQRAGDVIPQIVRVVSEDVDSQGRSTTPPSLERASAPVALPETCPSCGRTLVRDEDRVVIRCPGGFDCPAQAKERLTHFASRDAFDIDGLGDQSVAFLYETKRVHTFADIFTLSHRNAEVKRAYESRPILGSLFDSPQDSVPASLPLERENGWGPLSVRKLFAAIESRRTIALDRFLYALGIAQTGKLTAALLAKHYRTLDAFLNCSAEDLLHIEGIGTKTAEEILRFLRDPVQKVLVQDLLGQVTVQPYEEETRADLPLAGQTIVFTGKLETLSRNEAKAQAARLGAKIGSSVTKQTSFVVAGIAAGGKLGAAKALGTPVWTEAEWCQKVEEWNRE